MPLYYENGRGGVDGFTHPCISYRYACTAYKKATRAPTTARRPTPAWAAAPVDPGTLADEVPLAPPDEAVEAGPEAELEAKPEGRAELATGTLVLPAGGATEVTMVGTTPTELARVGTTTGTELTAEAEPTTSEEGMASVLSVRVYHELMVFGLREGNETAGTDVATAGAEDTAEPVAVAGGAWI